MYRILLSLVIIVFIIRLIWIYRSEKWDVNRLKNSFIQEISQFYKRLMMSEFKSDFYKSLRYLFISISVILFIILALTGIIPVVFLGKQMSGLLLIIHVTIAPFFVVALMLTAIFWAHFQQFDHSDFIYVKYLRIKKEGQNPDINLHNFWPKVYFWLFLTFAVPAILSMIFSMFPYFGTEGQIAMLNIHRYSTLVLLIIVLFYTNLKMTSSVEISEKDQVYK